MSIFEYRGTYYFDAFFYGPSPDVNTGSDLNTADKLGVFLHKGGRTREICEYRMQDPELLRFAALARAKKR